MEPQVVVKPAPAPKVAEWMLKVPGKTSCLDPGKKDYEVKELESAYTCQGKDLEKTRGQLLSLQKVVKEGQK